MEYKNSEEEMMTADLSKAASFPLKTSRIRTRRVEEMSSFLGAARETKRTFGEDNLFTMVLCNAASSTVGFPSPSPEAEVTPSDTDAGLVVMAVLLPIFGCVILVALSVILYKLV